MDSLLQKEKLITVPANLVLQSCGIGLDIGGSAFKAVYRTKENILELNGKSDGLGHLTSLSVASESVKELVEFIASRACIDRDHDTTLICCTGMGNIGFKKFMSKKLQVKLSCLGEFDCFIKAFIYLASNVPKSVFLHPLDKEAAKCPKARVEKFLQLLRHSAVSEEHDNKQINGEQGNQSVIQNGLDKNLTPNELEIESSNKSLMELNKDNMYPFIMATFGSVTGFYQVNADGSYLILDASLMAGKNFLALGCLLTGAKSFEELIELASKGDDKNVNIYGEELIKIYEELSAELSDLNDNDDDGDDDGDTDLYKVFGSMEGSIIYGFGKCIGKQLHEMNKADIAKALLVHHIINQIHILSMECSVRKLFRVYLCGSFFNSALARSIATTDLVFRNLTGVPTGTLAQPIEFEFVKAGSHLGALGTLLIQQEKFGKSKD